ncbi:competence protein ComK [Heyndrickxia coagulans]|uniref:Rok-like winged helix domain-containing protein n=1 Tax=Heyndrickxia coagulans TaxID=1398 RepID=UPI002DFF59DF|nr:competence protein ComK [Heyndrickxia coagulans]
MTINERMALKIRLEQLEDAEIRVIQEFQKEREYIFKRLRELDEKEGQQAEAASGKPEYVSFNTLASVSPETSGGEVLTKERKVRKSRPSRRSKSGKMREEAIQILKEVSEPIRGAELQRMIEEKTGFKIANMTSFMKSVEKLDPRIRKPDRGLYQFVNDTANTEEPHQEMEQNEHEPEENEAVAEQK